MLMQFEHFKTWVSKPQNKIFLGSLILMIILIISSSLIRASPEEPEVNQFTADTVIPGGFVLVPIEVENKDSLSSLIGQFGVVDLFATSPAGQRHKVARRLKLLRAPLNPDQFAVLVPEETAHEVLAIEGSFFVVVQNPEATEGASLKTRKKIKSRIEYSEGDL